MQSMGSGYEREEIREVGWKKIFYFEWFVRFLIACPIFEYKARQIYIEKKRKREKEGERGKQRKGREREKERESEREKIERERE